MNSNKKIYIVKSYGGEWEDSWQTIIGIYDDESIAKTVAINEWNEQVNWKNHLPIPFEIYQNGIENNYKIEQIVVDGIDDSFDPACDFGDLLGYTIKEWCDTYDMVSSNEYSDYCYTKVYEAMLLQDNSTYYSDENYEMVCIFSSDQQFSK